MVRYKIKLFLWCTTFIISLFTHEQALGQQSCKEVSLSRATVYVPLYSHIYFGDALKPFNLAATVSVRNIDPRNSLEIIEAEYRDSQGKILRSFLNSPISLPPFASYSFKVKESDKEGGSGASVIMKWRATNAVLPPLVESVMIGTALGQGISFTSQGKIISSDEEEEKK